MEIKAGMDYRIVGGAGATIDDAVAECAAAVKALLPDGWVPVGGVSTTATEARYTAAQAMWRKLDEREVRDA